MGGPLLLQFSIALFAGMVGATLVPPVRRSIPRAVEVCLWIAPLTACLLGMMSITDPGARELSASAAWGAEQVVSTMTGLALGGVVAWISEHRFVIANWLVIIAGADILTLTLIGSLREARPWRPRVWLGEWMELPLAARSQTASDPIAELNRKIAAAMKAAGIAVMAGISAASTWLRQELLPREARRIATRVETAGLSSRADAAWLQEATSHLGYAISAWYAATCEPAVSRLARRVRPPELKPGQVVDVQALLSAQSIGWFGPMTAGQAQPPRDEDAAEEQRADRLAS